MHSSRQSRAILSIATTVAAVIFFSAAQTAAAQSRTATEPGQIEQRLKKAPQAPERSAPIAPAVTAPPADTSAATVEPFVLAAVSISGATVYDLSAFAPLYEPYLGRRIGRPEVEAIVKAITGKYTSDGYFLSSAVAPPQNLTLGILSIEVTEGYIERVVFTGPAPGRRQLFDDWAEAITLSVPARLSEVERYILMMGDLPGVTATPSLNEPGAGEAAYEMTIALALDRFDASVGLDNRGTHPVGPLQLSLSGGLNSVAGLLERTRITAFTVPDEPDELVYGEIYEQLPVGTEGSFLWASASRSKVDIYSESRASQLQSTGDRLAAGFWRPLVRQQELALYVNGRFDYANSRQSALNDNFSDRLRVARAGLRLWFKDSADGTNNIALEYSRGLEIFGASPRGHQVSRADGESTFNKATLDFNRIQEVTGDLFAEINGRAQFSADTLLSGEEFALGGARFGRAYDPSEISDSRGIAGSLELRHRFPAKEGLLSNLWVYAFYDGGAVWRFDDSRDSLASTGAGLRIFPSEGVVASLELAKPLTRPVAEERNNAARVFFAISVNF